jgi:hypothetical protein
MNQEVFEGLRVENEANIGELNVLRAKEQELTALVNGLRDDIDVLQKENAFLVSKATSLQQEKES